MSIEIFESIKSMILENSLKIIFEDFDRPWGGFFTIDENDSQNFVDLYFNGLNIQKLKITEKLSPKILIILPKKRLSWQYHKRRGEIWKVFMGEIKVITSKDDKERNKILLKEGDEIKLSQGERHRIIGTDKYAIVAEIWIHTNKEHPSDEDDIIRIQDDYGR